MKFFQVGEECTSPWIRSQPQPCLEELSTLPTPKYGHAPAKEDEVILYRKGPGHSPDQSREISVC